MGRRDKWRPLLDAEIARWSAIPAGELISRLKDDVNYEVEWNSRPFQVEVQLLENTAEYVHVMVSVDDGGLRGFISPLTGTLIVRKSGSGQNRLD